MTRTAIWLSKLGPKRDANHRQPECRSLGQPCRSRARPSSAPLARALNARRSPARAPTSEPGAGRCCAMTRIGVWMAVALITACTPRLSPDESSHESVAWKEYAGSSSRPVDDAAPVDATADIRTDSEGGHAASSSADGASVSLDAEPEFSLDAWLREHGVSKWKPDRTCWARMPVLGKDDMWYNECYCNKVLRLAEPASVDLMVCARPHEPKSTRLVNTMHAVFYRAVRGELRIALEIVSSAGSDDYYAMLFPAVQVDVSADGADVVVDDRKHGQLCARSLNGIDSTMMHESDKAELTNVRRIYAEVCGNRGRWRWNGSRLVQEKQSVPLRRCWNREALRKLRRYVSTKSIS